jgi:hypothetical protein
MDLISKEDLKKLLLKNRPPCVSFFLPTTRGGGQADRILWKNLLGAAEKRLVVRGLSPAQARQLLGPARYLLQSPDFWQSQSDGLAYFLSVDLVRSFRLPEGGDS